MEGIVGFRCPKCGHKITASFKNNIETEVLLAWMVARSRYDKHVYGSADQEERDQQRCGDDCNG